jgi:hypothetical protein
MLEAAWEAPRRRQLARLPHGQFLKHAQGVIRGEPIAKATKQQALALMINGYLPTHLLKNTIKW